MFILGLWGVVNNVGIDLYGDVEFLMLDLYWCVVDVNFFGIISVIKMFLFLIRKLKGFWLFFFWFDWIGDISNLFCWRVIYVFVLKVYRYGLSD